MPLISGTKRFLTGVFFFCCLLAAQNEQPPFTERERAFLNRIEHLEQRLTALEARLAADQLLNTRQAVSQQDAASATAPRASTQAAAPDANVQPDDSVKRGILGLPGTTLNFYMDGYYGWNFNKPVGRVNLLRSNDVLSNNFSLNQVGIILERSPDVAAGRRYGGRVDLMFGQNTETLQGGAQNEPRPQVYRNVFQAYGSYVFPLGKGLTVDFGKFYGALGVENNYAYDEINYSRSFYFNYLPYYHTGFRTTYNVNDKLTVQHWLVNGANQTEDFNGYKSNAFLFTVKPAAKLTWNFNYYFGQEGRDLTPLYNPALPNVPTQPGLSIDPAPGPKLNGRLHIFDTYVTWSATPKTTVAGEFDYVISRAVATAPPSSSTGGAAYLQHRFSSQFYVAGRFEYLRDHGGLFSGVTQDLKEHTITAVYQPAQGFQLRFEHRRDFSDRRFFLTRTPGLLTKEQNTATLGLIWWFGGKRESW